MGLSKGYWRDLWVTHGVSWSDCANVQNLSATECGTMWQFMSTMERQCCGCSFGYSRYQLRLAIVNNSAVNIWLCLYFEFVPFLFLSFSLSPLSLSHPSVFTPYPFASSSFSLSLWFFLSYFIEVSRFCTLAPGRPWRSRDSNLGLQHAKHLLWPFVLSPLPFSTRYTCSVASRWQGCVKGKTHMLWIEFKAFYMLEMCFATRIIFLPLPPIFLYLLTRSELLDHKVNP